MDRLLFKYVPRGFSTPANNALPLPILMVFQMRFGRYWESLVTLFNNRKNIRARRTNRTVSIWKATVQLIDLFDPPVLTDEDLRVDATQAVEKHCYCVTQSMWFCQWMKYHRCDPCYTTFYGKARAKYVRMGRRGMTHDLIWRALRCHGGPEVYVGCTAMSHAWVSSQLGPRSRLESLPLSTSGRLHQFYSSFCILIRYDWLAVITPLNACLYAACAPTTNANLEGRVRWEWNAAEHPNNDAKSKRYVAQVALNFLLNIST